MGEACDLSAVEARKLRRARRANQQDCWSLVRRNGCAHFRTGMALLRRSGDGQSVAALPRYFRPRFSRDLKRIVDLDAQVPSAISWKISGAAGAICDATAPAIFGASAQVWLED